ncbi:MAG: DUF3160 domain-containing protein [Methanococcaceae archaeon]
MRINSKLPVFLFLFLSSWVILNAQTDNFDLSAYKNFLSSHQNLTSEQLYSLHPAGIFRGNLKANFSSALYNDSVKLKYQLTPGEISLIEKNGFMITERHHFNDFKSAFASIYYYDLPVFISTDAILDAIHRSYDKILKDIEIQVLIPKINELLKQLHSQLPSLAAEYSADAEMEIMLKDLDVYLTVARKLMGEDISPFYSSNDACLNELLKYIEEAIPVEIKLFSETPKIIDFSQFTVRGHYEDIQQPQLAKYFKAMIWLGRTEIYLLAPKARRPNPTEKDIQRQIILATLILEAVERSNSFQLYTDIDSILQFFVGEPDNVTLANMQTLTQELKIEKASQLLDSLSIKRFQDTLKTKAFAFQRILSQIIMTGFNDPDSIVPASAFLLLGQRFIVDSYVTSQVVFDKINYNGERIKRMLPSSQDVLFSLGNNASAQLLKKELETYHYGTNLAKVRYLNDSYGTDFWNLTIYNLWLNSIRKLNPPEDRTKLPVFMQTGAFWQEKMNTQLSSWAQLRHDNLLYSKQSYSGAISCFYPSGYVEPFPEFYKQIKVFADKAKEYFKKFSMTDVYGTGNVSSYFGFLSAVSDTLTNISAKELANSPLNENEKRFLKSVFSYSNEGCNVSYNGWYTKLVYQSAIPTREYNYVIADIHTAPTDEIGHPIGWVLHVATGPVNLGVFLAPGQDNTTIAFTGPVMSYYEQLTTGFKRLTDQEWEKTFYNNEPVVRPDFVNSYLANNQGEIRPEGASLITSLEDNKGDKTILPESVILVGNFPNPFNPSTVIKFSIPYSLSLQRVKLIIYNIQGEVIRELLNENLPSGSYLKEWDGRNAAGNAVSSGVYFYNLTVGNKNISGKMSLVK